MGFFVACLVAAYMSSMRWTIIGVIVKTVLE